MRRALAAILAAAATVALGTPVAATQDASAVPFVRIDAISPWLDADRPFTVRVQVANTTELDLTDVRLTVGFHQRVITRSELRSALDFGPRCCAFLTMEAAAPTPIEPGDQQVLSIREAVGGRITERGPYPLAITVSHRNGSVAFHTAIPFFPPSEAGPINLTWALPVGAPAIVPGEVDAERIAQMRLAELTELLAVLADRAPAPVTLVPSPALVDTLEELSAGEVTPLAQTTLDELARAIGTVAEVATTTYAPANPPALVAQGPPAELLRQVTVGRSTIEAVAARAPSLEAFVPADLALDPTSLDELAAIGVQRVVVSRPSVPTLPDEPAKLEPGKFGAVFPFRVREHEVTALMPDEPLDERLATSDDGVLLAQAIIAETLGAWQELPLYAPERVLLLARTPAAPAALAAALDGLASAPWVRLATLSDVARRLPAPGRAALTAPPALERPYLDAARTARVALETLAGIATTPPPDLPELERALMLATADSWLTDPDTGISLADDVAQRVSDSFEALHVADRRITLTSRTGDAPLTVVNDNTFAVRVRVRVVGTKVTFPEGAFRVVELLPGDNTFTFPVEVLTTGSFPVDVVIETPDGRRRLTTGTLVVRSTAVSAVSLAVVGGSALFLIAGWIRRARREGRSARRDASPSRRAGGHSAR